MAATSVVNEVITQAVLKGAPEAIRGATALDQSYDKLAGSSDAVSISFEKTGRATLDVSKKMASLERQLDPAAAAGRRLEKTLEDIAAVEHRLDPGTAASYRAAAQEKHAAAISKTSAALQSAVPHLGKLSQGANDNAKSFSLSSYQVQNLGFQLTDLAVQIGSGGGIFRPLLQQGGQVLTVLGQGEGGIRGAISGLMASIARIGPLGIAAFGAAGLAGAVGLAASAFSGLNQEIEKSEAKVRALTDSQSQANRVLAGAAEATRGTPLAARDLYELRIQAEALSKVNPDAFVTGLARLGSASHATREEMLPMIDAVTSLTGKLTITAGEAQKLMLQFPALADVLAKTFGTTPQGLLRLPPALEASTVKLEGLIAAASKGEAASASLQNLKDSFSRLWVEVDKSTGASKAWESFTSSLISWAVKAIDKLTELIKKMGEAAGFKEPAKPTPNAGANPAQRGMFDQPVSGMNPDYNKRNIVGGRDISMDPVGGGGSASSREVASNTRDTARNTAKQNETGALMVDTLTGLSGFSNALADSQEGWFAKQTKAQEETKNAIAAAEEEAKAADEAIKRNTAETAANTARINDSIQRQLARPMDPSANPTRQNALTRSWWGQDIAAANAASFKTPVNTPIGSFEASPFERGGYQNFALAQAAQSELRGGESIFTETSDSLNLLADAGGKAADSLASVTRLDLGQLGAPIAGKIDKLRSQQDLALSRTYRPDPYAERNPEFFYSGERIFKEKQDKLYEGLQTQIVKLENLQTSLATLVNQGASFPSAIVNAMIAAGFGDIAQQITTAFRMMPGAPASATPAPTAVQTPQFGTGTTAATPAKQTGINYNSIGRPSFLV